MLGESAPIAETLFPLTNTFWDLAGFPLRLKPYLHNEYFLSFPVSSTNTNMSLLYTVISCTNYCLNSSLRGSAAICAFFIVKPLSFKNLQIVDVFIQVPVLQTSSVVFCEAEFLGCLSLVVGWEIPLRGCGPLDTLASTLCWFRSSILRTVACETPGFSTNHSI